MEPIQYLRALRRRWLVIFAAVLVAVLAAVATTRSVPESGFSSNVSQYQATTILWDPGTASGTTSSGFDPATLAKLIRLPDVAVIAAANLKTDMDPLALRALISAQPDPAGAFLEVTAYSFCGFASEG